MDANVNDKIYRKVDEEKVICELNKDCFFIFCQGYFTYFLINTKIVSEISMNHLPVSERFQQTVAGK